MQGFQERYSRDRVAFQNWNEGKCLQVCKGELTVLSGVSAAAGAEASVEQRVHKFITDLTDAIESDHSNPKSCEVGQVLLADVTRVVEGNSNLKKSTLISKDLENLSRILGNGPQGPLPTIFEESVSSLSAMDDSNSAAADQGSSLRKRAETAGSGKVDEMASAPKNFCKTQEALQALASLKSNQSLDFVDGNFVISSSTNREVSEKAKAEIKSCLSYLGGKEAIDLSVLSKNQTKLLLDAVNGAKAHLELVDISPEELSTYNRVRYDLRDSYNIFVTLETSPETVPRVMALLATRRLISIIHESSEPEAVKNEKISKIKIRSIREGSGMALIQPILPEFVERVSSGAASMDLNGLRQLTANEKELDFNSAVMGFVVKPSTMEAGAKDFRGELGNRQEGRIGIRPGEAAVRERVAYKLSKVLGHQLAKEGEEDIDLGVPQTALLSLECAPGETQFFRGAPVCAVQEFIKDAHPLGRLTERSIRAIRASEFFKTIVLLGMFSTDAHMDNLLVVRENGKLSLKLIDNGYSLPDRSCSKYGETYVNEGLIQARYDFYGLPQVNEPLNEETARRLRDVDPDLVVEEIKKEIQIYREAFGENCNLTKDCLELLRCNMNLLRAGSSGHSIADMISTQMPKRRFVPGKKGDKNHPAAKAMAESRGREIPEGSVEIWVGGETAIQFFDEGGAYFNFSNQVMSSLFDWSMGASPLERAVPHKYFNQITGMY